MTRLTFIFLFVFTVTIGYGQKTVSKNLKKQEYETRSNKDSIDNIYIPKDLADCFTQLDRFWADSVKTAYKELPEEDAMAGSHFGAGLWMRSNWGLWGESRLSKYFNELGIHHPDDMSGIVLTSYHRHLNGKDIQLKEQVAYYKTYWEEVKKKSHVQFVPPKKVRLRKLKRKTRHNTA